MTKQDFFKQLKTLIGKFNEAPKAEGAPEVKEEEKKEEVKPEGEVKAEGEAKPEGETKPEGEVKEEVKPEEEKKEEFAKEPPAVDYASIQAELIDLRKKVSVLDEYTYLKERQKQLEEQVKVQGQTFASALELIQKFYELPTADPANKKKDGFDAVAKSETAKAQKDEWAEAFRSLGKK